MIRRRYLSRMFLGRLLAALLGLAGLLQLLDLLDNASEVLSRGGAADLARYAGWRLPTLLGQMMPLAVLVAAMLTLRRLALTSEMTALRSAGVPVRRVLGAMLPVCLLAVLAQTLLLGLVAPRTERAMSEWWVSTEARSKRPVPAPHRVWLRVGREIVGIDRVSPDGRQLDGVIMVPRAPDGLALARIKAASATWAPAAGWVLRDVSVAEPGKPTLTRRPEQPWPEGPPPADIIDVARPTNAQSPWLLARSLRGEQAVNRGPAYYQTRLQETAARLVGPLVMLLLAAPVAFGMPRRGGQVSQPLLGLTLGLGYLLFGGLLGALGEAGVMPTALAVWTAPVVFAAIGGMLLIRYEER
ncbi:MAG: hypothetical protein JWP20_917 [Roseomonas sp.]|nr:hypothetical protein [Roseomonas sp.]